MASAWTSQTPAMTCPKCKAAIRPMDRLFEMNSGICDGCGQRLETTIFPALLSKPTVTTAGSIVSSEEAACFYHQGKQASEVCDHCGRFLCTLCSVDWAGMPLCPDCVRHTGKRNKQRGAAMVRIHYDLITLMLAILPAIFILPTLISAPATLIMVVYHWRRPCSFVEKRWHARIRLLTAASLSLLQIAGWTVLVYRLTTGGIS
jgi:hypothetical protein